MVERFICADHGTLLISAPGKQRLYCRECRIDRESFRGVPHAETREQVGEALRWCEEQAELLEAAFEGEFEDPPDVAFDFKRGQARAFRLAAERLSDEAAPASEEGK